MNRKATSAHSEAYGWRKGDSTIPQRSLIASIRDWGIGLKLGEYLAAALVFGCLGSHAEAAGIQLINDGPALSGAIWYPCARKPENVQLGDLAVGADFGLMGAKDCPLTGAKLPLLIFSHGRDGWFGANHDTAEALADGGFVVSAINHPGDTYSDNSRRNSLSVLASRPVDMIRLLNFMLHDWKNRAAIDPCSVSLTAATPASCWPE
ncbi:MAG: hypothetical protein ACJ8EF_21620 [Bradyrhizobium sp.]|jgi:predicted dienelactone hydrolase